MQAGSAYHFPRFLAALVNRTMLSKFAQHAVRSSGLPAVGVAFASLDSMATRFASSDAASASSDTAAAAGVDVAAIRQRLASGPAVPPPMVASLKLVSQSQRSCSKLVLKQLSGTLFRSMCCMMGDASSPSRASRFVTLGN